MGLFTRKRSSSSETKVEKPKVEDIIVEETKTEEPKIEVKEEKDRRLSDIDAKIAEMESKKDNNSTFHGVRLSGLYHQRSVVLGNIQKEKEDLLNRLKKEKDDKVSH